MLIIKGGLSSIQLYLVYEKRGLAMAGLLELIGIVIGGLGLQAIFMLFVVRRLPVINKSTFQHSKVQR